MVCNRFGGFCHGLQKIILSWTSPTCSTGSCGMDQTFAIGRSNADGHVLYSSAESTHRMALEVGQDNREVIVEIILAHNIAGKVFAPGYRKLRFASMMSTVAMAVNPWSAAALRWLSVLARPPP